MFSDINARYLDEVRHNMDFEPRTIQGDVYENVVDKHDLIIASAVSTTSVAPHVTRPINPLFEGTEALETLLRETPEHLNDGGKLIVSHSSAGQVEFEEMAQKYGAHVKMLDHMLGLFRVEFLGDQGWVDYLVEREGLIPQEDGTYNHNMMVKEVWYE